MHCPALLIATVLSPTGENIQVVVTVAGAEKIKPSSLKLQIVTEDATVLTERGLTSKGSGAAHYTCTVKTPTVPFRLKLIGRTKKGSNFERSSRELIEPQTGVMRVYGATNDFTLGVGRPRNESIILQIYNAGSKHETFDFTAKGNLGYPIHWVRPLVVVRPRGTGVAVLRLRATNPADIGKTETLFITAKGRKSNMQLTLTVQLLVVHDPPIRRDMPK